MNGNPPLITPPPPPPPVDEPTVEVVTGRDVTVGTDGDAVGGETMGETGDAEEDSCCPPDGELGVVPVANNDESVVVMETSVTPDEPVDDGSVTIVVVEDSVDGESVAGETTPPSPIETVDESVTIEGGVIVGASVGKMTPPPPMVGNVLLPPSVAFGNSPLIEISVTQGPSVVIPPGAPPAPRPPAPEPPPPTK